MDQHHQKSPVPMHGGKSQFAKYSNISQCDNFAALPFIAPQPMDL